MDLNFFVHLAYVSLALLVALVAVYYALRLLGKMAKFFIVIIVIALVLWFIFSDHSIVKVIGDYIETIRSGGDAVKGVFGK